MKTNRTLKLITLTAAIFGFAATTFAQNTSSTTANAYASIITPIKIVKSADLQFGTIYSSAAQQTAVLAADGTLTDVTPYTGTNSVTATAASFNVTGNENNAFAISVSNLPTEVTGVTGGHAAGQTMAIGSWSSNIGITFTGTSGSVANVNLANGSKSFNIGASLTIAANQVSGAYSSAAPFTVTVAYE